MPWYIIRAIMIITFTSEMCLKKQKKNPQNNLAWVIIESAAIQ